MQSKSLTTITNSTIPNTHTSDHKLFKASCDNQIANKHLSQINKYLLKISKLTETEKIEHPEHNDLS